MAYLHSPRVIRSFAVALGLSTVLLPSPASACGGFFCSQAAPVNQAAERIIFAQDGDTTTQIVEILYEGPSERFAWVLPVPGVPVFSIVGRFANYDGFLRVFSQHVAFRDELAAEDFIACPDCYVNPQYYANRYTPVDYGDSYDESTDPINATDIAALFDAIDEEVLAPIHDAAALFETNSYVTRLYTTMSADDMTLDPVFDFNADLEEVSNVHTATRVWTCEGPWSVELPDGQIVQGTDSSWPLSALTPPEEMPFNTRVVAFSTQGLPRVEVDRPQPLNPREHRTLLDMLEARFSAHPERHQGHSWGTVRQRLEENLSALRALREMEETGGEPDVVRPPTTTEAVQSIDCAAESPSGRQSLCYDAAALASRKENKAKASAIALAGAARSSLCQGGQAVHTRQAFVTTGDAWFKVREGNVRSCAR